MIVVFYCRIIATYSEGCCFDAYVFAAEVLPTTIENHKGKKKAALLTSAAKLKKHNTLYKDTYFW
jgi:hypothetical protein